MQIATPVPNGEYYHLHFDNDYDALLTEVVERDLGFNIEFDIFKLN